MRDHLKLMPPPGEIAHALFAQQAAKVLNSVFGDLARAEALTRALVQERGGNVEQARFWVKVFHSLDGG